jgi:hypothetical protein
MTSFLIRKYGISKDEHMQSKSFLYDLIGCVLFALLAEIAFGEEVSKNFFEQLLLS